MKKALILFQLIMAMSYSYAQNINIGTQTFNYNGTTLYHYGVGWYPDVANTDGPMAYISAFGGIRFFTNGLLKSTLDINGHSKPVFEVRTL